MYKSRLTVFVSAFAPVSSIRSFTGIPLRSFRSSFFSPLINNATSSPFRPRPLGVRWMRSISMKTANGIGENSARGAAVVPADLSLEMSRSYMEYAMSVILRRAMPDVRDGLKPVHRRLLFAMHDLGLNPNGKFRKSARVVGEVLGKYHPHGETAVYDALVRMSQDFSMGIPLINGHGNFGSTDGDPPAAMRYTECKLSALAKTAFFEDLDKDTVEHISNFDGSEIEPLVLPARVPNLLLNGSSGIAVGMATNIPPHNLRELVDALIAMMKNPELTDEELLKLIPGPDFPTGGQILGTQGSQEMHLHGRGRIVLRACVHHEVISNENSSSRKATRHAIVVTELPYQVNKANLVQKIADLVNSKKLEGIADLRDESDRSGTRIVIELKRDAVVGVVLNNLYKKTHLMTSFAANIMALDNGRSPVRLSLRNCLEKFLNFRRETVRRGVLFDLRNAEEREHIVDGLLIAQKNVDDVVRTIRNASDSLNAKSQVMKLFEFSERQADSVLSMQLRRLTVLEKGRLEAERAKLLADIAEYRSILADASKVDKLISDELQVMVREYAMPRRSIIIQDGGESGSSIDERSLVANDRSVVVVTQQGYIKRMPIATFGSQKRGTRGKKGLGQLRKNDMVAHFFMCMAHDKLLVIAKNGIAYDLPAHKVPVGSPTARGVPLFQLLPDIEAGQTMASVLPVSDCQKDEHLVLLTQAGLVKKTPLSAFQMLKCSGKMIIRLDPGDELRWVRRCSLEDSVIIASEKGFVIRFLANNSVLRATGRASRGIKSIKLADGDAIASMDVVRGLDGTRPGDQFILAVTKQGGGKRVGLDRFPPQGRGGTGRIGIKFKKGSDDRIVSLSTCFKEDSVMLATRDGTIVRQVLSSIPLQSRFTRGVLLQRLQDNDAVAAVTILPSEFETGSEVTELPGPVVLKEDSDSTDSVGKSD